MSRDTNRDTNYFKRYIELEENSISNFESSISMGKVKEERISIVFRSIGGAKLRLIIAKYSLGESVIEIEQNYLDLLIKFEQYWPVGHVLMHHDGKILKQYIDYNDMLWMLSLGYLFNVPNQYFESLGNLLERDNVVDYLYEFLLSRKLNREPKNQESYEYGWELYKSLRFLIQKSHTRNEQTNLIKVHLEKEWEKDNKGILKSINGRNPTYYGAWSFESAAIVAALGLDDSNFKDNKYYPKDLVTHFKKEFKWANSLT